MRILELFEENVSNFKKEKSVNKNANNSFEKKVNNKGITLITLVLTIIVLLVLAGIAINAIGGPNGIITKAQKAKDEQDVVNIGEKLETLKGEVALKESNKGIVPIDDYIKLLEDESKIDNKITKIEKVDSKNAYITVDDKYEYLLEQEEQGNLKIIYNGLLGELKPRITKVEISNTTNSIEVKVEATRAEKYIFYIKEEQTEEYAKKGENTEGKYTYSGLTQNKTYYIKVEVTNRSGKDEQEQIRTTSNMPNLEQAEIEYTTTPNTWTNENVVTTVKINTTKNIIGYTLQYAKMKEMTTEELQKAIWSKYEEAGIISSENETIVTRLYDGTNSTSYTSTQITKIDKVLPVVTGVSATTNSVTITATDEASGIIGYAVTTTTTKPSTFTSCTNTKSLNVTVNNLTQGNTYYAWVKDEAGNISASKTAGTGSVTGLTSANTTFTITPNTWTNGNVTVTVSTTVTGYTLQTSTNGTKWDTTNTQTLTTNGPVYARVVDSTGQAASGYASTNVTKIDKTLPTKPTVNLNGYVSGTWAWNNENVTESFTSTDTGSGIAKYQCSENGSTGWYDVPNPFTISWNGQWNLWIRAVDNAGNISAPSDMYTIRIKKIDSKYYNATAGTQLANVYGRLFYKSNNSPAIIGIAHIYMENNYFVSPILISTNASGVYYYTNHSWTSFGPGGSVVVNGNTFYYSNHIEWIGSDPIYTSNFITINSKSNRYTSVEQAARALITQYFN